MTPTQMCKYAFENVPATCREDGGLNLYGFVGNDPLGKLDLLGAEVAQIVEKGDVDLTCHGLTNEGSFWECACSGVDRWGQPGWDASGKLDDWKSEVASYVEVSGAVFSDVAPH